jgi:hypothetical protein
MFKLLKLLFWIGVFAVLLGGLDRLLLQRSMTTPGVMQFQTFYVDFRSRLLGLISRQGGNSGASIEGVIEQSAARQAPVKGRAGQRYVYADKQGVLHFVESLTEVPPAYRQDAQLLEE